MNKINNNLNVLIFPSGSGVAKEIFDSLKYIRWINIFGLESNEDNYSTYQFDNVILDAPFIIEIEKTLYFLKNIINHHNIDCIFPAMDNIIVFLKKYEKELNVKIISSDIDICNTCFSKKKTYNLFNNLINVPKLYSIDNIIDTDFPLFIKPECGYGSRNSLKVNNKDELIYYNNKIDNLLICEYLPGEEYTIDCFSSEKNGLIFCEARTRTKTLNGMSILTKNIEIAECKEIGKIINDNLKLKGAWFFQIKKNKNNDYSLLEIAPRIPGGMCLHRVMGINFSLLSIYEHFGINIDNVMYNNYNVSCYKYFENNYKTDLQYEIVYVDLDDTLIIKNKVNTKLIRFLYHAKNNSKKIILITRNISPIIKLNNYCISEKIFDNIICCDLNKKKSDYITTTNAIFIDDSFMERIDVFNHGINVFNCDMIEVLLDEKL